MSYSVSDDKEKVIIIGAGPAGLTAAHILSKNGIKPLIIERDNVVGGIARTVRYKDYYFDIGGHRFFTKNPEIENLWKKILGDDLLVRPRLSRWYYRKKFFEYPIKPFQILTVFKFSSVLFFLGYLKSKLFPIHPETNLEDWYKNQFGEYLAKPFFVKYNEKLWGIPCHQLSMDFGKQRVRGVSFLGTIFHAVWGMLGLGKKKVASLIDSFHYPKYGPGMMWEKLKNMIEDKGGKFLFESEVVRIKSSNNQISSVVVKQKDGSEVELKAEHFLTSLPLKELIYLSEAEIPEPVTEAARRLKFRAFVTVALIIKRANLFPDTWIYTHDPGMKCIRIQNFNNWSPFMVGPRGESCLGFEYTCDFGDDFWDLGEEELKKVAIDDLVQTGFAKADEVIDSKVVKLKEVYPVYDLNYQDKVMVIKDYLDKNFNNPRYNLQPIGRGGMHKYNNMDHSMMTGILAARNILGQGDFNPWRVNIEAEYQEEK